MEQEKNKKKIVYTVIAVALLLISVVGLTYAYFAVGYINNADINTKANVVKQVDSFTTSGEAELELSLSNEVMQNEDGKDDYSVFQTDSDTFTVSILAGSDRATCTYDLAISSEEDTYTKSTGLDDLLEYTIEGTEGNQSFSEINVDAAMNSTITPGASDESGTQVTTGILGHYTISDSYDEGDTQNPTTQTWTITSKFYNLAKNQNDQLNKTFEHHIKIVNVNCKNGIDNSLYSMMKKNADTDTTIDFNVRSGISGTNGIYVTTNTDSGEPVYYYRGTVDNNLKWAGFCWKIIRTTETGGTKILYNGTPNASGACTNSGGTIGNSTYNSIHDDNTYVGYMIGTSGASTYAVTHSNVKDSTIKTMIDEWYEYNIQNKGLTVYLEDTVYCNDRNLVDGTTNNNLGTSYGVLGYGKKATGYGVLARSSYHTLNASPSLVCKNTTGFVPEDNDSFTVSSIIGNGKLKYPVGLITSDEVVYAGMNTKGDKSAKTDYLDGNNYLSSVIYWTMSPSYMATGGCAVVSSVYSSYVNSRNVHYDHGVRPVVSLRHGTQIISGFGTKGDPYVVE